MAGHTPGPWTVDRTLVIATDDRQTIVCDVSGAASNPITQADAQLIAAAPDLLDALREQIEMNEALRQTLRDTLPGDAYDLVESEVDECMYSRARARAAIRKAEKGA